MKFEVPQRRQLASERTSLTLFAPAPSTISFVPLTRNLSLAEPSPYPVRGWTGLSEATATRFPGSGQPSAMCFRKRAVPKTASYGTEYAFGAQKCLLGYATHHQRHSVQKTGFYGTEEIFGTGNALLRYGIDIRRQKRAHGARDAFSKARRTAPATSNASSKARRTADSTDCGQPPAAPDASSEACRAKSSTCRSGSIFSARNAPALFVRSGGPFPCSFDGTRYQKQPTARR